MKSPIPSTTARALSWAAAVAPPLFLSESASAGPTVYLAGDSTMAARGDGAGSGTQGWGEYFAASLRGHVAVVNAAVAGRSARSYTVEGHFADIAALVHPGDWVVIEFGHNDGGTPLPATQDNGRSDCPGASNETCTIAAANGTAQIIRTYPAYLSAATDLFRARGARIVLASPTPDNPWEGGTFSYAPNRFTYFTWLSVARRGGPDAGVWFVPHGQYVAQAMRNLGPAVVDANYPIDGTHTAPYLADIVAQAFVLALKCGTSGLSDLVENATARIEGPVLGTCVLANSTLPI